MQKTNTCKDIEFIKEFDPDIGKQYASAKKRYQVAPIETLVLIREVTTLLCKKLAEEFRIDLTEAKELRVIIESIKHSKVLSSSITNLMHELRRSGNEGAHPDIDRFDKNNYKITAKTALITFCSLIEELNVSLGKRNSGCEFIDDSSTIIYDIAYKAAYLDDAEAKHQLGRALIFEGQDRLFNKKNFGDDGYIHRGVKWLEEACNYNIPGALYDMGLIKMSNMTGESKPQEAIDYLLQASYGGHDEAKGYLGALVFKQEETEYYEEALMFLNESVTKDSNPLSLITLSELYMNGRYVSLDEDKALTYLSRAVDKEYPPAFYMKAQLNLKNHHVDQAIELFEKCVEMGVLEASFTLAQLYQMVEPEKPRHALNHFEQFLKNAHQDSPDYAKALYGAEKIRFSLSPKDLESQYKFVSQMIVAYQLPNCNDDLRKEIESVSPDLMKQYKMVLRQENAANQDYWVPLLMVNKENIPRKNFTEVAEELSKIGQNANQGMDLLYSSDIYSIDQRDSRQRAMIETKTQKQMEQRKTQVNQKLKNRKANKKKRKQRSKSS